MPDYLAGLWYVWTLEDFQAAVPVMRARIARLEDDLVTVAHQEAAYRKSLEESYGRATANAVKREAAALAEVERLKLVIDGQADLVIAGQKAPANQREHDLLRQMHLFLSQEDLITLEEYAVLVSDHDGTKRLEDYDRMRIRVAELEGALNRAEREG